MGGLNRSSGQTIDDVDHIRQSVTDILTTPVGSRVKRREYGSLLPDLIDHPGQAANRMRLMAATTMALIRWEPRLAIQMTTINLDAEGHVVIDIDAIRTTGPRSGEGINIATRIN